MLNILSSSNLSEIFDQYFKIGIQKTIISQNHNFYHVNNDKLREITYFNREKGGNLINISVIDKQNPNHFYKAGIFFLGLLLCRVKTFSIYKAPALKNVPQSEVSKDGKNINPKEDYASSESIPFWSYWIFYCYHPRGQI